MAGLKGVIVTKFHVRRAINESQAAIHRAMQIVAQEMEEEIRATIQAPGPPASAPWTPPHFRSGRLSGGLRLTGTKNGISVRTPKHGFFLEYGTSLMDPRPFIQPILFSRGNRGRWTKRIAELARQQGMSRKRGGK